RIDTTPAGTDWVACESAGWKVYSTAETDKAYVLFDLSFSRNRIVPRPITFVSTISEEGVESLAPFRLPAYHIRMQPHE
ncbi:hypothetical protein BDR05DRAFT_971202, partial [Suillus weaverae]